MIVKGRVVLILALLSDFDVVYEYTRRWRVVVRFTITENSTFHIDMLFEVVHWDQVSLSSGVQRVVHKGITRTVVWNGRPKTAIHYRSI
jgi:hypothetical protein